MVLGIALIVLGVIAVFWTKKRAFDRTNSAGVQEFSGFGHMVASRSLEKVALIVGLLLILGGFVNVATSFFS